MILTRKKDGTDHDKRACKAEAEVESILIVLIFDVCNMFDIIAMIA